ncbi:MAG: hypothetical protein KDK70_23765 [Myxococcales bacterium]|nr:hypothetical protein [Myxococcales bacterium]
MLASALMLAALATGTIAADWQAPPGFEHVVPRLSRRTTRVLSNLRYEGNNRALRTPPEQAAAPCADAEHTRALALRTAGLFVLRDALFSQQDHPVLQPACALMLPPNWVTAAVDDALAGRTPAPVAAPALDDDAAWARLDTPARLFGGFPASASLHGWATRERASASADDRRRIDNARGAVHTLAAAAERLREAVPQGAEAVARAGAELIAGSDRAYFGDAVRHDHAIPMFVENPSEHEIVDEGKGLEVPGRTLDPAAVPLARRAIYRRRLQDGAMAIERYDITDEADVRRAIEVLQMLVPRGSGRGHQVYVWVGGPLLPGTERVADVHDRVPQFLAALEAADIEPGRVTVFARPVFQSKGKGKGDLVPQIERARAQGVLYGVNMNSVALRRMREWTEE